MAIDKIYGSLFEGLSVVYTSLPPQEVEKIQVEIGKPCSAKTTEAAIKALNELLKFVQNEATILKSPLLAETFEPIINGKLQELSSLIPPPDPSDELSKVEAQILSLSEDIKAARQKLSHLSGKLEDGVSEYDFVNAMLESIAELKQRIDDLQKRKAELVAAIAARGKRSPSIEQSLSCAGLRNVSNKCYMHACLKGLWSSRKFREIIERKAGELEAIEKEGKTQNPPPRRTALYLNNLFLTFDATTCNEVIEPTEKAIVDLRDEMAKYHPRLKESKQEDSTEFLNWLLDDIFKNDEQLFIYNEIKERPAGFTFPYVIPNVDVPERIPGNLFVINLPRDEKVEIDPQCAFNPSVVEEEVDPLEAILKSERNKGVDPSAISEARKALTVEKVMVTKHKLFTAPPPPCLFVHLWRQGKEVPVTLENLKNEFRKKIEDEKLTDEQIQKTLGHNIEVKMRTPVKIAPQLIIRCDDQNHPKVSYHLKSVIVHDGEKLGGGHYYTYVIDTPSIGASRPPSPSRAVQHNDASVSEQRYDASLDKALKEQGYVLIYDIDEGQNPSDEKKPIIVVD